MSNYVPVRLNTLKGENPLDFDLFIKVGEKFLLYTRNGDAVDPERISSLKAKRVRQLFITEEAEMAYQAFLEGKLSQAASDKSMSNDDKADIAVDASSRAVEMVYEQPESSTAYILAQKTLHGLVDIISQNDEVVKAIFNKEAEGDQIYLKHAINVSSLVIKLGGEMKMSWQEVTDLGMAGYFHDIGMVKMAPEDKVLFTKPLAEFTAEEWDRYKEHPRIGADIFKDRDYATPTILELILTHEELLSGTGFPQGLKSLNQAQEILSVCCTYDRRVNYFKQDATEVLKAMMIEELNNFDLTILKALKKILKSEGIVS